MSPIQLLYDLYWYYSCPLEKCPGYQGPASHFLFCPQSEGVFSTVGLGRELRVHHLGHQKVNINLLINFSWFVNCNLENLFYWHFFNCGLFFNIFVDPDIMWHACDQWCVVALSAPYVGCGQWQTSTAVHGRGLAQTVIVTIIIAIISDSYIYK